MQMKGWYKAFVERHLSPKRNLLMTRYANSVRQNYSITEHLGISQTRKHGLWLNNTTVRATKSHTDVNSNIFFGHLVHESLVHQNDFLPCLTHVVDIESLTRTKNDVHLFNTSFNSPVIASLVHYKPSTKASKGLFSISHLRQTLRMSETYLFDILYPCSIECVDEILFVVCVDNVLKIL